MYDWMRPQIAVPVHGEAAHLAEHGALARGAGVPKVVAGAQRRHGAARAGTAAIIDEVPAGRIYKDGVC